MAQQDKEQQKKLLIEIMNEDDKDGIYEDISKKETTQTAVEWLSEKYMYVTWLRNRDEISPEVADSLRSRYLEQANQMEKKQIIDAWKHGDGEFDKTADELSEQYFKQTYEK